MLTALKSRAAHASRTRRAALFRQWMQPAPTTLIVDLGGGKGRHFARYFPDLQNVVIADYNLEALSFAEREYGFRTRRVDGADNALPFADGECDIIFCSSVIEHVTGPKHEAIARFKRDGQGFRETAWRFQQHFAQEIRRCAKSYWVQTPNRYFPIEVHSWLPLLGYMPTHWQWAIMRVTNRFWPRKDENPDWALLSEGEMRALFPDAKIVKERWGPWVKSIIAVRAGAD